ncbi:putative disease resistance protein RGA4 isoform X1 [Zingiber officinale]|nr:putative disease resistance protein RGA4 isoform X1 [Zingiber officinale]
MAGALVGATAGFLANKVAILVELDEKLKAMAGTKRKMEKFKELLTNIDSVIQNVESRPFIDDAVKDLLKKLKYLAYDLEDVVDYYDTKVLHKKQRSHSTVLRPVRDFFSTNNQVLFKSRIGSMIKAITESLESILLQKSILLNLPPGMSQPSPYRENHSRNRFVVIGREPEKEMIVNMLIDDDDESSHETVKVIAIVGMGGLGKTTLAQLVFHDETVKIHFASLRMWTVVEAEFDPLKIMNSVLELATGAPANYTQIDSARQNLEKVLTGKKFLLVLDDVWNEDPLKWGVLKAALICGVKGSKILVTTRSLHISSIMGSSKTHQLQQLSKDHCLSLFQQFAFGDQTVDQSLMEIGGKIVEKCGGVPLAAISLGSMLHSTRDESYWSSLLSSKIWKRDNENNLLAVLKLSYNNLSLQSKKCFTFGSLYPKNCTMVKDELIKLWIANDFVRSDANFDAETIGNHVFTELVHKSFFLLASSKERDFRDFLWASSEGYDLGDVSHVTNCTMHDVMHDLARSVSVNIYWNDKEDLAKDIGDRIYHLHMHKDFENLSNTIQARGKKRLYLRTLILKDISLNTDQLEFVFSNLKFLRVLDLTGNKIKEVPTSIRNLIHLRYLNLSRNIIEVLSDSITLLANLQYLNLSFNEGLQELPKELWNMQSLRDLDCRCCNSGFIRIPCGLSRLTNLQSLPVFVADSRSGACSITELEDLKLNGEMTIKFSENFTNYSCGGRKILQDKHLKELSLEFNRSETNDKGMLDDLCPNTSLKKLGIWHYGSSQFPTWFIQLQSQLPNLVEVSLNYCRGCEHIPPFGNLHFLKKLDLISTYGITHLGAEFHGNGGFPSLQELNLHRMNNLKEWSESHGADQLFPSLQRLRVYRCPELKCMPRLPNIQSLEIFYCDGSLLSYVGSLTSLSILRVEKMDNMTSFPSGCIRNLTSLIELRIIGCDQLLSLPRGEMKRLKKIRSLTIDRCDSLAFLPSEVGRLNSLRFLRLAGCPRIKLQPYEVVQILNSVHEFEITICGKNVNLHEQLQRLYTLRELFITGEHDIYSDTQLCICCCEELESLMIPDPASSVLQHLYIDGISNLTKLPDWLQHLESLRFLSIHNCSRLETLPRLLWLQTLTIIDCPQLKRRYERDSGEDWPIIAHVPYVDI